MKKQEKFGELVVTQRGFQKVKFDDENEEACSIQESSRAVIENKDGTVDDPLGWIWLGIESANPRIMKSVAKRMGMKIPPGEVSGWMDYPLPDEVLCSTRMLFNEKQVRGLMARLQEWLDHAEFKK